MNCRGVRTNTAIIEFFGGWLFYARGRFGWRFWVLPSLFEIRFEFGPFF